jgi:hypothetical protein
MLNSCLNYYLFSPFGGTPYLPYLHFYWLYFNVSYFTLKLYAYI